MAELRNVKAKLKPAQDLIADLSLSENITPDTPFAFSAICRDQNIIFNCIIPAEENPYTLQDIVLALTSQSPPMQSRRAPEPQSPRAPEPQSPHRPDPADVEPQSHRVVEPTQTDQNCTHDGGCRSQKFCEPSGLTPTSKVKYVVPPLASYITMYQPLFNKIVAQTHPYYKKLIPDRDDMMQILYLTVTILYNKGYYLHKRLIQRSYTNALNMEVRKIKPVTSLNEPIATDANTGETLTMADILVDPSHDDTSAEDKEQFARIKAVMLEDITEYEFSRILVQLKTKTVNRRTSYLLSKCRKRLVK